MENTQAKFVRTKAINKLRRMTKRIRVVPGGTSAGKTYGILPLLIDVAARVPNLEISIVSESVPHLRKGAWKDFLKIMKDTGRYIEDHYNRTLLTYTFGNGSYIEAFSVDQESRVRGPRRNILYINEVNNISFETYHQLAIRTDGDIWMDFNPSNSFWVHEELQDDEDVEWLTLTYKDNSALADSIVKEIEKGRDKAYYDPTLEGEALFADENVKNRFWHNWWKVYGLGMLGSLEGVIFTNWDIIPKLPKDARLIGYGIDFGFTNDPTTLIGLYSWNNTYIWDEMLYKTGLTNGNIARIMKLKGIGRHDFVVADSAEPKSIREINEYGFRVTGAVKGKDSIVFGIGVLQENNFLVTQQSTNMIKELRTYSWETDKQGNSLNYPIDAFNHTIDPMRYLATAKLPKQKQRRKGLRRRN